MALVFWMDVADGRCGACSLDRAPRRHIELARSNAKLTRLLSQLMQSAYGTCLFVARSAAIRCSIRSAIFPQPPLEENTSG